MYLIVIKSAINSKSNEKLNDKESHNYKNNYKYNYISTNISINIDLNRSPIEVMNQILVIVSQLLVKQLVFNVFKPVKQQNHRLKYFN